MDSKIPDCYEIHPCCLATESAELLTSARMPFDWNVFNRLAVWLVSVLHMLG